MSSKRAFAALCAAHLLFFGSGVGVGQNLSHATMQFGLDHAGSPFPPPSGHDQSTHAKDSMVPRTVVITRGGSVTFQIAPFHRVAIYAPGTRPSDIAVNPSTLVDLTVPFFIPRFNINDPNNRIQVGPPFDAGGNPLFNALSLAPQVWTTPPGTFDVPGRYLVVCTTRPHLVDNDMFGWVMVR